MMAAEPPSLNRDRQTMRKALSTSDLPDSKGHGVTIAPPSKPADGKQATPTPRGAAKPAYLFAPDASSGELWKVTHWHYAPCPTAGAPSFYSHPYHRNCTCSPPNLGPATPESRSSMSSGDSAINPSLAANDTIEWTLNIRNKFLRTLAYRRIKVLAPHESADWAESALKNFFPGRYRVVRSKPNQYRRLDCKYPLCDFRARVVRSPEDGLWYAEDTEIRTHHCYDGLPLPFQITLMNLLKSVESSKAPGVTMKKLVDSLHEQYPEDPLCQASQKDTLSAAVQQFLQYVRAKQRFYRERRDKR